MNELTKQSFRALSDGRQKDKPLFTVDATIYTREVEIEVSLADTGWWDLYCEYGDSDGYIKEFIGTGESLGDALDSLTESIVDHERGLEYEEQRLLADRARGDELARIERETVSAAMSNFVPAK